MNVINCERYDMKLLYFLLLIFVMIGGNCKAACAELKQQKQREKIKNSVAAAVGAIEVKEARSDALLSIMKLPQELEQLIKSYCFFPRVDFFSLVYLPQEPIFHGDSIKGFVMTTDGRVLFTISSDRCIKAWNRKNGECLASFEKVINDKEFSAKIALDEERLLLAGLFREEEGRFKSLKIIIKNSDDKVISFFDSDECKEDVRFGDQGFNFELKSPFGEVHVNAIDTLTKGGPPYESREIARYVGRSGPESKSVSSFLNPMSQDGNVITYAIERSDVIERSCIQVLNYKKLNADYIMQLSYEQLHWLHFFMQVLGGDIGPDDNKETHAKNVEQVYKIISALPADMQRSLEHAGSPFIKKWEEEMRKKLTKSRCCIL